MRAVTMSVASCGETSMGPFPRTELNSAMRTKGLNGGPKPAFLAREMSEFIPFIASMTELRAAMAAFFRRKSEDMFPPCASISPTVVDTGRDIGAEEGFGLGRRTSDRKVAARWTTSTYV